LVFTSQGASSCGSLAFPRPGCPGPALDTETAPAVPRSPHPVVSLSKTRRFACRPRRPVTEITSSRGLLSWSSSKIAPPPTSPCASTLGFPRFGFATPERVPPLSFFPTSAVCSAHGLQVCCTLLPVMGFAWFRADRRLSPAPDPPPRRPCPSKLFAETVVLLSPGALSSASLVHDDRSHRFPRPRGFVPSRSSTWFRIAAAPHFCGTALLRRRHELPWVSLDPGLHRSPPSPEDPAGFPGARCFRIGFSPAQRPLCTARDAFPLPPSRRGAVALETGTRFPMVPVDPLARAHLQRDRSPAWRRPSSF